MAQPPVKKPAKKVVTRKHNQNNEAIPKGKNTFENQQLALALRAAGATYREIGQHLGISHTWALTLCRTAQATAIAENVEEMRVEQTITIDKLKRALWGQAMEGHVPSAMAIQRLEERRAKLWGLDAALQVDVSGTVEHEGAVLVIEGESKESYMATLQRARPSLKAVPNG